MVYNICIKALNFDQVIIRKRQCIYNLYVIHHYNCISKVIIYNLRSIFHELHHETLQWGRTSKSVLTIRERGYCNRLKTLQGCTTFPTRGQDQRPYPRPRISVNSCPQPFTQIQPAMSERSERTSAPEPPITLHHDSHRIRSRQGVTHANRLTVPLLSMWFVRKCTQETGDQRDGP